jgi:hypothetical protein
MGSNAGMVQQNGILNGYMVTTQKPKRQEPALRLRGFS